MSSYPVVSSVDSGDLCTLLAPCKSTQAIRLALHVPDKNCDGEPINHSLWITKTVQLFSHYFGGATVSAKHQGFWLNPLSKKLIEENTSVVMVFADPELLGRYISGVRRHVLRFGHETRQGEVMLEVGNRICLFKKFSAVR